MATLRVRAALVEACMVFLPDFFLLQQIMSGGNLVVHRRTSNRPRRRMVRNEWLATQRDNGGQTPTARGRRFDADSFTIRKPNPSWLVPQAATNRFAIRLRALKVRAMLGGTQSKIMQWLTSPFSIPARAERRLGLTKRRFRKRYRICLRAGDYRSKSPSRD